MSLFDKEPVRTAINCHAYDIACHYAGAPVMRYGNEVRIGNKGARVFHTRKGLYHDLETGTGGDGFTFVQALTGCSFAEVPNIVAAFAGGHSATSPTLRKLSIDTDEVQQQKQKRERALHLWRVSTPLNGGSHAAR
jgi:hypothetical protein